MADLYTGYPQVVLTDYARSQLEEAQRYLGSSGRYIYVVADIYRLPFAANAFDVLTMVRVMHHLADVPTALHQLHRVLTPQGTAVIEYASKLNLKAIARWLLRRQQWNPFDYKPHEFVELNFNFHPAWMRQQFQTAGFQINRTRSVSHYRINLLKRLLPTSWLVALDSLAQPSGNWWQFTPSLFVQAQAKKSPTPFPTDFFCCPVCGSAHLTPTPPLTASTTETVLVCAQCHAHWSYQGGIYDFKTPLS
ncbi:MAG: class I SAM-dependent methyltransferase [Anaerolineae bacterium]